MLPRTILHVKWLAPRLPKIRFDEMSRSWFRVMPTDLDVLMHVNNGKYLSMLDIGRLDFMVRTDAMQKMSKLGWYTVVGAQTITYRKSLRLFQKFAIETRLVGLDERAAYVEQRFVVRGEVYARAFIQGRFLKKRGGNVSVEELAKAFDLDPAEYELHGELRTWAHMVRLPSTRKPARSEWSDRPGPKLDWVD